MTCTCTEIVDPEASQTANLLLIGSKFKHRENSEFSKTRAINVTISPKIVQVVTLQLPDNNNKPILQNVVAYVEIFENI